MIRGKTIFITGGAGFIGNTIISRIIAENDIVVFDNFHRDTLTSSGLLNHPRLRVVRGDVLDYAAVRDAMRGADIVIHAAAIAGIDTVIRMPVQTMRVNMIGTANVLEAARENRIPDRVIDFSTSEVFGPMAFRVNEADSTVSGSAGEAR